MRNRLAIGFSRLGLTVGVATFLLTGCASIILKPSPFAQTEADQALLGDAIQSVSFHVPKKHVYILVEPKKWRELTTRSDRLSWAVRRATCFAIYDHLAKQWEFDPHETTVEVYALVDNTKQMLLHGTVLDCSLSETASVWPWLTVPVRPSELNHRRTF